ncbi:lysophospholipase L1-like esterase [Streptosporangium album]|uniref:Lysophospholipase L1-like esterase n=1 Tax=Streptosporangium album TaxID=47479 RepID=A0A7W7S402_9ACTN|nr:GDSL-type esterase/lipase family protein [Streptosporangium album]MBB4943087.1 lysophospholipase L1-like esterase [Streptosporangium album]
MTAFTGVVTLTAAWATSPAAVSAAEPWRPVVMVATGDSISAGFNACGWYVPCASRSWAAGDGQAVLSHYLRLRSLDEGITGHNVNLAVPGATSANLAGQMAGAVARRADYVTVLIGAQDACVSEERLMTPVAVYQSRVTEALKLFQAGRPGGRVFVASIPDLKRLWRVGRDNVVARGFWALGRICPTMLARPTSTAAADRARRDRVRDRVVAYNAALARVCAAYGPACRFDGNALFATRFTLDHLSRWDFFHPNAAGQQLIAQRTFETVRDWAGEPVWNLGIQS